MRQRLWAWYLVGGASAVGLYFSVTSPVMRMVAYSATDLGAALAMLVGVRLHRPAAPAAWYLFAAGLGLFFAGDVASILLEFVAHAQPSPSVADALYLSAYGVGGAGLVVLARARRAGSDRAGLIESLIVGTAALLLAWVLIVHPYLETHPQPLWDLMGALSFPVLDVVVLAFVARFVTASGRPPFSLRLSLTGVVLMLGSDIADSVTSLSGMVVPGSVLDASWMISLSLYGAVALHPSMRVLSEPSPPPGAPTRLQLALLLMALLLVPALLVVQTRKHFELHDAVVFSAVSAILVVLVMVRVAGLARELQATAHELDGESEATRVALARLSRATEDRAALLRQSLEALERERRRLGAELEVGPVRQIARIGERVVLAQRELDRPSGREALEEAGEDLSSAISSLRAIMGSLRPPVLDERGLEAALRDHAARFASLSGVDCEVEVELSRRLGPEVETLLYRVVEEALANVARHANATRTIVSLRGRGEDVELVVADDGGGAPPGRLAAAVASGRYGIHAMKEQVEMAGGRLDVQARPGAGTTVRVCLPAEEEAR